MGTKWLVATLLWVLAGSAAAVGQVADVTLADRANNRVLPVYRHEGRYYVVGAPGYEYEIRVRNRTGGDVLAVVSVDGVNAVTGETAAWEQSGDVPGAYQSYGILGWRTSPQRMAAFFFTQHENSYAARTGRHDNIGVIGVAVFREKAEAVTGITRQRGAAPSSAERADLASATAAARGDEAATEAPSDDAARSNAMRDRAAVRAERKLGTGHGYSETSRVTKAMAPYGRFATGDVDALSP